MKALQIQGFTEDVIADAKPALCIFGDESTGTTRFGTTAPHDDGYIGWLALDRNSKQIVEEQKARAEAEGDELPIIVNKEPLVAHKEAMRIALIDNPEETKKIYTEVFKRATDLLMKLCDNPNIESIVIDRASQIYDYILFAHFGRRNQIDSKLRAPADQDMIDLINALSFKNLVLIHKASEIWKDTGQTDKMGRAIQAPIGKFKPDGFNKVGRFVTAVIELTAKMTGLIGNINDPVVREKLLKEKYRAKVVTCKGNTLLEGRDLGDLGVCGEGITWERVLTVLGVNGQ